MEYLNNPRRKKSDKKIEKFQRNGKFSSKSIRIQENLKSKLSSNK